ncbi:hypothetical protein Droror1_Dr00026484, partial [Drosera rotundifolia]
MTPVEIEQAVPALSKLDDLAFQRGFLLQKIMEPVSTCHLELWTINPWDNPNVTFNYFKEQEDMGRCIKGIETIGRVINSVKDGEVVEKAGVVVNGEEDLPVGDASKENVNYIKSSDSNSNSWSGRRDGKRMGKEVESLETQPVPRVLPKDEDPKLVSRNRRMLGQLLGTLE